jgi:hypothetical protein
VSLNTHAPLRLPGTLSTAGHCDQSRAVMFFPPPNLNLFPRSRDSAKLGKINRT